MIRSEPYGQKTFFLLSIVSLAAFAAAALTEIYVLALAPFLIILFYLGWNNFLAIYLLLLFTLPFSIEYSFSDSLSTDIPDEGLMWLVSLLALIHVANKEVSLESKLRHPLVYLLGLHLAWILLTIVFSSNHLLSLKFFLAKSWYIISFLIAPLILLNDKRRIRLAAMVLLGSILLAMLIILVRHAFLGFSFASINEAAEWFFRNHVNYSAMLVCAFPMLLAFYLLSTSTSKRKFIVIVSLVTLVALYFTYARGAWLALAAGGVSWWLIRKKWLVQSWLLAIVFALLMIFWLKSDNRYLRYAHDFNTTIFHENFQQHLIATYQLKDVSTAERFYRWIAGIRMIGDKPLTGFGPSTFY